MVCRRASGCSILLSWQWFLPSPCDNHRNSHRAIHCFHGRGPKTCGGLLFTIPANIRHRGDCEMGWNTCVLGVERQSTISSLVCRTVQISPHLVQLFHLDCREGLYCYSLRLTSSLALGHWSLRVDVVVSGLFSYCRRWGLVIPSLPFYLCILIRLYAFLSTWSPRS